MTTTQPRPSRSLTVPAIDTSVATWRSRAIRYVLIYLALVVALVTLRALTREVRPGLLSAQERETALMQQRDELAVRVQTLENPQRVRDWALSSGMIRFAQAPNKTAQVIAPLNPPLRAQPPVADPAQAAPPSAARPGAVPRRVEVRTQWK